MSSLLPHSPVGDLLGFSLIFVAIGANRVRVMTAVARRARKDARQTITEDGTEFRRLDRPSPQARGK